MDSVATKHITSDLDALFAIYALSSRKHVHLQNGQTTTISHVGKYKWDGRDVLKEVLVVSDFEYDLLCASQLTEKMQCSSIFFLSFACFKTSPLEK